MADPRIDQTGSSSDRSGPPRTPRWVIIFGLLALIAVVVVGIMLLSGGEHGPGRHMRGGGGSNGHTPPVQHSS